MKGLCVKTIFTLSSCNDLSLLDDDGSTIVTGHLDHNLRLWDIKSGNLIHEVTGIHGGQITSVETSSGKGLLGEGKGGKGWTSMLDISSTLIFIMDFYLRLKDQNYILTTSRDNTLKILDVRTYQVLNTFS